MKKYLFLIALLSAVVSVNSQTYLISTGGTVNTCSGSFYDAGGSGSNYSNGSNQTMTFCAPAGSVLVFRFSNISIENNDYLYIHDGSGIGAPIIATYENIIGGTGQVSSSGTCITFHFTSGASGNNSGWAASICCSQPNNLICNATPISLNGSCLTSQSNVCSSGDYSLGCSTTSNTLWYAFQLDAGMNTIDVSFDYSTIGSGGVQMMLVHGPCTAPLANSALCGATSSTFQWTSLSSTETYYLSVSSANADVGIFDLCITQSWIDVCGDYYCGDSEDCSTCPFDCGACPEGLGGPYNHPVTGIQNTYVGQCMVSTCSGSYYDSGGAGSNYSNSTNNIYRTFCPDMPGNCMVATINSMNIEYVTTPASCPDMLFINNGPTQNSTTIWSGCGNSSIPTILGTSAYGTGVFTSTHSSGCLTFRFSSNAANNFSGWDISLSCVPCAGGPSSTYNNDCSRSIPICNDISVNSEVWGPGLESEGCGSCVTSENFTEWFYFEVATSGTMQMSVKPVGNSDIDFALYEATDCNNLGAPVRCSYAAYNAPGWTGMATTAADLSEDVSGNQWVAEVNIVAGQSYFLMINEWNKLNPNSYSLDWNLTNGASFDCGLLPIELLSLTAKKNKNNILLEWITSSEINNEYFTVLKSNNGVIFKPIGKINGAGNSNNPLYYSFVDEEPLTEVSYYQLKQTDFDGKETFSQVVAIFPENVSTISNFSTFYDFSNENITINFYGRPSEKYSIEMFSVTGQKVYSDMSVTDCTARADYRINTSSIPQGIYSMVVRSNDSVISKKVVISR